MRAVRMTVALIVALTLTACQSANDKRPTPAKPTTAAESLPKAGHCYADQVQEQIGLTPDLTTKIDCSKKHLFEITGVVEIPSKYLRGGQAADRERLGDQEADSLIGSPWERYMERACSRAALKISGLDDLTVYGGPGVEALAEPVVSSAYSEWSVTSEKQWKDGDQFAYCVLHFDESEDLEGGDDDSVASSTSKALVSQFTDHRVPGSKRYCVDYVDDTTRVSCDRPHDAEGILSYDVDAVLGARFAKKIDLERDLSQAQYETMLLPCVGAIPQAIGPYDADLFPDILWGGWEWEDGRHRVTCVVTTDDDHVLPGRSVIGNARKVSVKPAGEERGA